MKLKISVIVPVYQSEKYLKKCIESILQQTYKNIELILVDDGSPDSSGSICDAYLYNDERIIVLHKKNAGVSDTRNCGLNASVGSIIFFVDPDDWIETSTLEMMYNKMESDKSDIVVCGVKYVNEENHVLRIAQVSSDRCLSTQDAMRQFLHLGDIKQQIWDKMYKKETIGETRFPVGRSIEDVFWVHQVIGNANNISILNDALYNYLQRPDSVMGAGYTVKWMDSLDALEERCNYIQKKFPLLLSDALSLFIRTCMYHLQLAILTKQDSNVKKEIISRIDFFKIRRSNCKLSSIKLKIWINLFVLFPTFICKLRNLLKVGF